MFLALEGDGRHLTLHLSGSSHKFIAFHICHDDLTLKFIYLSKSLERGQETDLLASPDPCLIS
jgi:hypothetical protein